MRVRLPVSVTVFFASCILALPAAEWQPPEVVLPADRQHPVIALPSGALKLLRDAHRTETPLSSEVKKMVSTGEKAIRGELSFPPRGGHHNQWYQCDDCQTALRTVSDIRHRCPSCEKVYSGEPYDDVVFARRHSANLRRMRDAAWAYAVTEDEKFAAFAKAVLLGYAERYLNYPYRQASRADTAYARKAGGRLYDQTLTEASHLQREITETYDLIHDSKTVSSAEHQLIRDGLIRPMLESIARYGRGEGNWQTFHNTAMFWAGAVLGEPAWMERSIFDPENGFLFQMEASVSPDGLWYEGSWSYHFYTLSALAQHAQGAMHLGIDLWGHPSLKKMFALPVTYQMSDGTLPRFGDATTLRPQSRWQGMAELTEAAYAAYEDENLLPILPNRINLFSHFYGNEDVERTETTITQTVVLPDTGHALLRTRGKAGLSAAFTFAPYGGYHSHFDKLSFVLFGFGEELAVDRGRAASQAYRLPIHREWYKATVSHNTVLVDGQDQKPAAGELLFHQANEDYAAVVAKTDQAYPGVDHRRMLFLTPGYLLIFDELTAEKPRRFDWFYHQRGEEVLAQPGLEPTDLSPRGAGFSYIQDSASASPDGPISATFRGKKVNVQFLAAGASGTTLTTGHGPGRSVKERVPLLFLSRRGSDAKFAAVIEPFQNGETPRVTSVTWRETREGIEIAVTRAGGFDRFLLTPEHRASIRFDPPAE